MKGKYNLENRLEELEEVIENGNNSEKEWEEILRDKRRMRKNFRRGRV